MYLIVVIIYLYSNWALSASCLLESAKRQLAFPFEIGLINSKYYGYTAYTPAILS
jgi:hypothetical protein